MVIMTVWRYKSCLTNFGSYGALSQASELNESSGNHEPSLKDSDAPAAEDGGQKQNLDWLWELVTSLSRLGLIMLYFFLCDRLVFIHSFWIFLWHLFKFTATQRPS